MTDIFNVIVPFTAITRGDLSQSKAARLPPGDISLPSSMLVHETGDGCYTATLEIEAQNPGEAREFGVMGVEQLCGLLAISGDLFEIEFSKVVAEILREVSPTEPTVIQNDGKTDIAICSRVWFSGHLDSIKTKGDMQFEANALTKIERWPDYLRRGIDLNYSAVRAVTNDVRFLLLISALEMLALKKLGAPETLLKTKFNIPSTPLASPSEIPQNHFLGELLAFARHCLHFPPRPKLISYIVLPLSICIERANHWAFWKAVGKSV
jgi:hypothetical protein